MNKMRETRNHRPASRGCHMEKGAKKKKRTRKKKRWRSHRTGPSKPHRGRGTGRQPRTAAQKRSERCPRSGGSLQRPRSHAQGLKGLCGQNKQLTAPSAGRDEASSKPLLSVRRAASGATQRRQGSRRLTSHTRATGVLHEHTAVRNSYFDFLFPIAPLGEARMSSLSAVGGAGLARGA